MSRHYSFLARSFYLEPCPSIALFSLVILIYCGGLGGIWIADLSLLLQIGLSFIATVYTGKVLYQEVFYQGHPLWGATVQFDTLLLRSGFSTPILPYSYSHPYCVIIRAADERKQLFTLIILPDSLEEQAFHRLRVRVAHAYRDKTDI